MVSSYYDIGDIHLIFNTLTFHQQLIFTKTELENPEQKDNFMIYGNQQGDKTSIILFESTITTIKPRIKDASIFMDIYKQLASY